MKHLLALFILVGISSYSIGQSQLPTKSKEKQNQLNSQLEVEKNEENRTVTFVFHGEIPEQQGRLLITDLHKNILLDQQVEVIKGQVFQTVSYSIFSNSSDSEFLIELQSEAIEYQSTFSL